ncbi:TPA: hypothetical protein ACG30E_004216 [Escherichia coli]|uniref:hypothetical protein n=1 Tax=Escherichia coli TaxID=562 RepID=UPI00145C760D|nr:hypothetical protein [Escherichia coli]MCT6140573.1 hypothetical protein [Escherichia coli]MDI1115923.1 hypothetical protein [Escherichia coli]MDI1118993.1 hypothetical protein [Escherichia coli]MDI1147835.1 hypothetical protein [Escherichia coli]
MTNKESTNTPSPARKRRRRKIEHESERFAPCAFALEQFLKEYRETRPLQVWKRNEPKG